MILNYTVKNDFSKNLSHVNNFEVNSICFSVLGLIFSLGVFALWDYESMTGKMFSLYFISVVVAAAFLGRVAAHIIGAKMDIWWKKNGALSLIDLEKQNNLENDYLKMNSLMSLSFFFLLWSVAGLLNLGDYNSWMVIPTAYMILIAFISLIGFLDGFWMLIKYSGSKFFKT